jgi:hypothetical protein
VRKLLQPELLDLALRVQAQLAFDADFDPEPLAVESVLIPLVESPQCLVPLEDVLQRPAPRGVDAEGLVRRDRAVDEAPLRATTVLRPHALERVLAVPELEHVLLERRVVGDGWKGLKNRLGHGAIVEPGIRQPTRALLLSTGGEGSPGNL